MAKKKKYSVPDYIALTHILNESGWVAKPMQPDEIKVKCENQQGRTAICMYAMETEKDASNLKAYLRKWEGLHVFNNGKHPRRVDIEVKYNREFTTAP